MCVLLFVECTGMYRYLICRVNRYLGGNSIVVVEGLQEVNQLQELHVENQRLSSGEKLLFDARSLQAIAVSIGVLQLT